MKICSCKILSLLSFLAVSLNCSGQVRITEFSFGNAGGEFIELTNVGTESVDLTGWRFCDKDRPFDSGISLSFFGSVAAGESVVMCDITSAAFISFWNQPSAEVDVSTVRIMGSGNGYNGVLSSRDILTLYNASAVMIDQLDYYVASGTTLFSATSIADSATTSIVNLGADDWTLWDLSSSGDMYGSWQGVGGIETAYGSPGYYAVPEPSGYAAFAALSALAVLIRRKVA